MGKYDVDAEEGEIRKVLAGKAKLDDIVKDTQAVKTEDSIAGLLARIMASATAPAPRPEENAASTATSLYPSQVTFLTDALEEAYKTPEAAVAAGGVGWRITARSGSSSLFRRRTCGNASTCSLRRTWPSGR